MLISYFLDSSLFTFSWKKICTSLLCRAVLLALGVIQYCESQACKIFGSKPKWHLLNSLFACSKNNLIQQEIK